MKYLREWYAELSTKLGLLGLVVAVALIIASFAIDEERYGALAEVLRQLGIYVMIPGLVGILYREKPKPPSECG